MKDDEAQEAGDEKCFEKIHHVVAADSQTRTQEPVASSIVEEEVESDRRTQPVGQAIDQIELLYLVLDCRLDRFEMSRRSADVLRFGSIH